MRRALPLVLTLLLTGCAAIPSHTEVQVINSAPPAVQTDGVSVIVRPPNLRMTMLQAAQGFIAANASVASGYAVARKYLTAGSETMWQPKRVQVFDPTTLTSQVSGTDKVTISFTPVGLLDSDSRLYLSEPSASVSVTMSMRRTASGWRVSSPPATALMSLSDLQRNFTSVTLWFLNNDYTRLVPDVAWLPRAASSLKTRIVRLLLEGPSGPMSAAVATAIPAETRLQPGVVSFANGVYTVLLDANALTASPAQRVAMLAQLTRTIAKRNTRIQVQAGGQTLAVDGRDKFGTSDFQALNPNLQPLTNPLYFVRDGVLYRSDGMVAEKVRRLAQPASIAVRRDGMLLAAAMSDHVRLYDLASGKPIGRIEVTARDMDFDIAGRLWLLDTNGSLSVLTSPTAATPTPVQVGKSQMLGMAVSPDGARLAGIVAAAGGRQLRVFPVVSSTSGVSLGAAVRVERYFKDVIDAEWLSAGHLAIAGRVGVEATQVFKLSLTSLQPQLQAGLSDATAIHATPAHPLCVSADSLRCLIYGVWKPLGAASTASYAH